MRGLGVERHGATACNRRTIGDFGRALVARDVHRHRSADAHLAAACAFVHWHGLGRDVGIVFSRDRNHTCPRINRSAAAHQRFTAGVDQVQRQRASDTHLASTRTRSGVCQHGVCGVTGHVGHGRIDGDTVGLDDGVTAHHRHGIGMQLVE